MRSRLLTVCFMVLALGAGLLWSPLPAAAAAERGPARRSVAPLAEDASLARVIVKYRSDSTLMKPLAAGRAAPLPQHAATLSRRLSLPLADGRVLGSRTQGLRGTGLSSSELVRRLAAMPEVEWVVPDRRRHWHAVPTDPYYPGGQPTITPTVGQWYLRAPDSTAASAINAAGAWDLGLGSASVTVAVLDTGVRFDHPDLASKLYPGYDFIADRSTANDGGGRDSDASDPGDWTTSNFCGDGGGAEDSSWHGTQVSGLIAAARNNGIGIAGVGGNVMLLPVRVLGRCGGYDSDIIAGMRWAAGVSSVPVANPHPARVINMSLGGSGSCDASYRDAVNEITAAGVTIVAAAGNDTGHAVGVPANCLGVIAVAGVRHLGSKVGYSSIGPEVTIAAPAGNCVNIDANASCLYPLMSTTNLGTTVPGANGYTDSFNSTLGTSFSSPLVAGTVALMLSANPSLTPAQVKSALKAGSRRFPTSGADVGTLACAAPSTVDQLECYCTTTTCGAGLLDAAASLSLVTPGTANYGNADSDRVLNFLESRYPQYVAPSGARSVADSGYYYRYYAGTKAYVGTAGDSVYYLVPSLNAPGDPNPIKRLGSLADWLAQAAAAGF
jgi:serine protease